MGDELIDLEVAALVIRDEAGKLAAALDTTECAAFPYTTGDELEGAGGDFLAGGCDTDDDGFTPALVAGFEGGAHDVDIAGAVECVVAASVGHLDELLLDGLVAELGWVDKVCGAELLGPLLLCVVDIYYDDLARLVLGRSLDDG